MRSTSACVTTTRAPSAGRVRTKLPTVWTLRLSARNFGKHSATVWALGLAQVQLHSTSHLERIRPSRRHGIVRRVVRDVVRTAWRTEASDRAHVLLERGSSGALRSGKSQDRREATAASMSLRARTPVLGSADKSSRTTVERSGCVAVKLRSARAQASAFSCQIFRATLK
jgi:hypothetical protein